MLSLGVINKERNHVLTFLATLSLTQLILIWWPSLFLVHVLWNRSRMIKCGKSCKEKGHERCEVFNNKDRFQNRNEDWPKFTKQNQV